jgi:hypothetical protein
LTAQRAKACEHELSIREPDARPLVDKTRMPPRRELPPPLVAGLRGEDRQFKRVRKRDVLELVRGHDRARSRRFSTP